MSARPRLTTDLPKSLVDQLKETPDNDHPRKKRISRSTVSRKESRKQERATKKQRRSDYFSSNNHKRPADEGEHAESPKHKKLKVASAQKDDEKSHPKPKAKVEKPKKPAEKFIAAPILKTAKDTEEDAYIAYLESKLGYTGGKRKAAAEDEADELDDLFDFASTVVSSRSNNQPVEEKYESSSSSESSDSEDEGPDEEEWKGIGSTEDSMPVDGTTPEVIPVDTPATRYIPPHLRKAESEGKDSETIVRLTRQLNGLLNKMSEQNMATILDSVEEIYRNHARNDVTSTLTRLVINNISSHSSLLDSYVVLYAAFVSALHKIIGIEFAAFFVQQTVAAYDTHYAINDLPVSPPNEGEPEAVKENGKEVTNLLVLISELYNFQVISSILVFDVVRTLLEGGIDELRVELLVRVLRNSGQQLRQDDPSALKDIIQIVQNKMNEQTETLGSRTRFLLETLTNLKNNKAKRNTTLNQGGDAVERMKKFLGGLAKKKHVLSHEPLRVSLQDLRSADSKGKWWLVGAAWGGDPLVDRQEKTDLTEPSKAVQPVIDTSDNMLMKLARKQGMNTDIRRSIFVVLMSSDDYVDACERLGQLNLTEIQQRDIIRVLLHCCGNEKTYNPYYTLVCQHLCKHSHAYKITLQFCLWDFLRDLGETKVGGVEVIKNLKDDENTAFDIKSISPTRLKNVAKAYAWWIAKDATTLAILKPVDFTAMKDQAKLFLKEMFTNIFISSQIATPTIGYTALVSPPTRDKPALEGIFLKATRITTLAMGIVYFLTETFRTDIRGDEDTFIKWSVEIAKYVLKNGVDGTGDF